MAEFEHMISNWLRIRTGMKQNESNYTTTAVFGQEYCFGKM